MSGTKPANLSTTSKDFPQDLLDQINYVVSDIYAWISELRGNEDFKHDADSSEDYITAAGVTYANLLENNSVGSRSDQVARGDRGVTNGDSHDHSGGDGGQIAHGALSGIDPAASPHVTNGDAHDHSGGDGGQIAYSSLSGLPSTVNFVDRGDPAAADFTQADLTTDGNWKTGASALDFSSIVPSGAKAMLMRVAIQDNATGTQLVFRKSGQTNQVNCGQIFTQAVSVWNVADSMILPCSSDRKVEYMGTNTTIDSVLITVKGWWI